MITHIVLFKLKDRSAEKLEEARAVLAGLDGNVPVLRHLEVGVDVIGKERSYDIALTAKFDTLEDLAAYQVHPEHIRVKDYIVEASTGIVAVDYES